jgi:hypothetical protein
MRGHTRCIVFWWKNLKERDHLEDLQLRRENNIEKDLQEVG